MLSDEVREEAEILAAGMDLHSRERFARMLRVDDRRFIRWKFNDGDGGVCLYETIGMAMGIVGQDGHTPGTALVESLLDRLNSLPSMINKTCTVTPLISAWDSGTLDRSTLADIFDPRPKEDDVLPPRFVKAFTGDLRLMTPDQMARAFAGDDAANLRRVIRNNPGLLEPVQFYGRSIRLDEPLVVCEPNHSPPDCGRVSYQALSRWKKAETTRITAYRASEKLVRICGGTRLIKPRQESHDLGVSSIYTHYAVDSPELLEGWLSEDQYGDTERGEKRPDARMGERIIEFCGAYPKERIEALVELAQEEGRTIELW